MMDQDISSPSAATPPKIAKSHDLGFLGSLISASGVTLLVFSQLGAGMAAIVWASSKLLGLPDMMMYGLMVLGALAVVWATIWTAGRAWHVEKLLSDHKDIDRPVFKLFNYYKRTNSPPP